jgi:hypothetical protein
VIWDREESAVGGVGYGGVSEEIDTAAKNVKRRWRCVEEGGGFVCLVQGTIQSFVGLLGQN